MKQERSIKDYGGGCGRETFRSDTFRVALWKMGKGVRTTIESNLCSGMELQFDGEHSFDSDEVCMEQFEVREILEMIEEQKTTSYEAGRRSKAGELRKVLGILGA